MKPPMDLAVIRSLLSEDFMARRRYQDPKVEVRKDVGRPYYYVRVSVPIITAAGVKMRRERRVLGFVDEMTMKEAKAKRGRELETVNNGHAIVQSQIRFKDIVKKFLDVRVPQLGFATQNKYQLQIDNHILPAFGEMQICDIDKQAIEAWLTNKSLPKMVHDKEVAGLGWWSRVDLKGIMSGIFTAAKDWKLWDGDNPCHGVRIGKKTMVREKRLVTRDKLRELLAALPDRERFMILIAFAFGLRVSEILGLKWMDIDFEVGSLKVTRRWHRGDVADPKTPESKRTRRLGPVIDEFKRRYPGPHAADKYIFGDADTGRPPDDRDVHREILRPAAKRLGIYFNGFGFHTFRRQNISWRQEAGATPLEAQKMAGHAKLDMTYLYTVTDDAREEEQLVRMMDRLMEVEGGKPQ